MIVIKSYRSIENRLSSLGSQFWPKPRFGPDWDRVLSKSFQFLRAPTTKPFDSSPETHAAALFHRRGIPHRHHHHHHPRRGGGCSFSGSACTHRLGSWTSPARWPAATTELRIGRRRRMRRSCRGIERCEWSCGTPVSWLGLSWRVRTRRTRKRNRWVNLVPPQGGSGSLVYLCSWSPWQSSFWFNEIENSELVSWKEWFFFGVLL